MLAPQPKDNILSEIGQLRRQISKLQQEKADLEFMIDTTLQHADIIEDDLFHELEATKNALEDEANSLREELTSLRNHIAEVNQEKEDLEEILKLTTEYSDSLADDLLEQVESTIKESEKRFRTFVTYAADAIFVHDLEGNMVLANDQACLSLGYSQEEILQLKIKDIEMGVSQKELKTMWSQLVPKVPITLEGTHRRKDGTTFPLELRLGIIDLEGKPFVMALARDITERKKAEQTLLENSRMDAELKAAADVQRSMLPKELPCYPNLEMAHFFEPALETGGDWFGFMTRFEPYLYILIGDVTGHGTPAAMMTTTANATLQVIEEMYCNHFKSPPSPAECLRHMNRSLYNAGNPDFLMTCFIGQLNLESYELLFANAAHNFPYVIHADGKTNHLLNTNPRLGNHEDETFNEKPIQLKPGDTILFYTDGLIENENAQGQMWGEHQLSHFIKKNYRRSLQAFTKELIKANKTFCGNHPSQDDVTVVACRIAP